MKKHLILIVIMGGLLVGCSRPPADLLDAGPPPDIQPTDIMVLDLGGVPMDATASVYSDLRGQFVLPVSLKKSDDVFPVADQAGLFAALDELRGDLPLTHIVVAISTKPIFKKRLKTMPQHGAVSVKNRCLIVSCDGIDFDEFDEDHTGPNLVSKMALHLFAHAMGAPHLDGDDCLMNDWGDNLRLLERLSDHFCPPTLMTLSPWLKSRELGPPDVE